MNPRRRRTSNSPPGVGTGRFAPFVLTLRQVVLLGLLLLSSEQRLISCLRIDYYDVNAPLILGVRVEYELGDLSDRVQVDMNRPVKIRTRKGESHGLLRELRLHLPTEESNIIWNAAKHRITGFGLQMFLNDLLVIDYDVAFTRKYGLGMKKYDDEVTKRMIKAMSIYGLMEYVKLLGDRGSATNEL